MPPVEDKKVDIKKLKGLYAKNVIAKAAFDYFATRQNNATLTKVERLEIRLHQAGHEFSHKDVITFLKEIEKAGCGRFVIGRRGQPSRFEWDVQVISVAKAAKGEEVAVARLEPGMPEPQEDDDVPAGVLRHPYRLRQDLTVNLELPGDLTSQEALRLAEFIKTLPFEQSLGA